METNQHFTCAVIGDWHLAFVTAAGLASLGHKTILLKPGDTNKRWQTCPELYLEEPEVNERIGQFHKSGLFSYGHYLDDCWSADFVWLAIDTEVREDDSSDLTSLEIILNNDLATKIHHGLVITSQVPLGFCQKYKEQYNISYIPENLRLGYGLETFLSGDRLIIGSDSELTRQQLKELLKEVKSDTLTCDLNTAEMIKHATNAFLATSISLSNQLAMIGDAYQVDNHLVGKALKLDSRIGKKAYIIPGTGFAGGTLPRDLKTLQKLGKEKGIATGLIDSVLTINKTTLLSVVRFLESYLGDLENKKILLLGYSYKVEINTLRRSPAIDLAKVLQTKKANITGHDPEIQMTDLDKLVGLIQHLDSLDRTDLNPDICIVLTPRPIFKKLDWKKISPRLVFDLDGTLNERDILNAGIDYKSLWQPLKQR